MLNKLFPPQIDNDYQGNPIAKWMLGALTVVTFARSLIHVFAHNSATQTIVTMPLTTFTHNGAATVILMVALWGLAQFLMTLVYIVVLWRYQKLIPFMYVLIITEYSVRLYLMHFKPVHIYGAAPGVFADYIIIPVCIVMLIISLTARPNNVN